MAFSKRQKQSKAARAARLQRAALKQSSTQLEVTHYSAQDYQYTVAANLPQCLSQALPGQSTWINVVGLQDIELITQLTQHFKIHPLVTEDIFNTEHRAKVESYDNYLFVLLKSVAWDEPTKNFKTSQISLILGADFLVSLQEQPTPLFDKIKERLGYVQGRLRANKCDYLAYALIDMVVDHYFVVLENFSELIEMLENEIIADPQPQSAQALYHLKQQMYAFRKAVWPLREMVNHLLRDDDKFFSPTSMIYLRDVYDHTIQTIETIETFHDRLDSMLDVHLSTLTNRMNEVMKVLTIIATIFIPLTFIASVFGMNFTYLPGLNWHFGYPVTLAVMGAIALLMIIYFKIKHWW